MAANPAVSIVLLTYNRADMLDATIESLLGQTETDFELIVADDASSDHTPRIGEKWAASDSRVQYHRRSVNLGRTGNMNLGVQSSAGRYVAILHDDDIYDPKLLQEWVAALDDHPNAGFVFNAYRALDGQDKTRTVYRVGLPRCLRGAQLLETIFFKRWRFDSPVWGTAMIRRSAFNRVGEFDNRFGTYSDVDMWMRLADEFDVCYIDRPLISVRSLDNAPHLFDDRSSSIQPILEKMFWEARIRHYRNRPMRLYLETVRHLCFAAAGRGNNFAFAMKHKLHL